MLALPILLAVVALIINYGTLAAWKVRALTVARHQLWSNRVHRTGTLQPTLAYWQTTGAAQSHGIGGQLPELDDSRAYHQVARGPLPATLVKYQGTGGMPDLFDPARGFATGSASLVRSVPLLVNSRSFQMATDTHLVQDHWDFSSPYMSWWDDFWQNGLGDNTGLRIPVIYKLDQADAQLSNRYVAIVQEVLNPGLQDALRPMWADWDDIMHHDASLWPAPPPPGWRMPYLDYSRFNPRFPSCSNCWDWSRCSTDTAATAQQIEGPRGLIDQIRGNQQLFPSVQSVPRKMVSAYIAMYSDVMSSIDNEMVSSPPSNERLLVLTVLRAHAEQMRDALNQFLSTITY